MPFKSQKQRAYFHALEGRGELPKSINLPEWDKASKGKKLPEYASPAGHHFSKLRSMMGKKK